MKNHQKTNRSLAWLGWSGMALVWMLFSPGMLSAAEGGISGWVLGQTESGESLGVVPGAKVEFLDADGNAAYSAKSDAKGHYSVGPLPSGEFEYSLTYRVSAEGFRTEDEGRGILFAADGEDHVQDFTLTKGSDEPTPFGALNGHVWRMVGESKEPVTEARIAVRAEGGGSAMILDVDEEGAYEMELPAGDYRVSAMMEGRGAMVHPEIKQITSDKTVTVDFVLDEMAAPSLETTVEVYALVSVQVGESSQAGSEVPKVEFVAEAGGTPFAAKVRLMEAGELGFESSGLFKWYHAEATTPLPEGRYVAKADLAGYAPGTSDSKDVAATRTTTFDVALRPLRAGEVIASTGKIEVQKLPGVSGWVLGQTESGEPLGVIQGAKIEFLKGDGTVAASAQSSDIGFYAIEPLEPGEYAYRVTAAGYAPEDAGRGFSLPDDGEMHVHDFTLTQGDPQPTSLAELNGHVWMMEDGEKVAVEEAVVAIRTTGESGMAMIQTDEEGAYEVMLPTGSYGASATVTGFPPVVHPSAITLAGGDEKTIDFTVGQGVIILKTVEVYALVSVQLAESDEPGGNAPEVMFVDETSGKMWPTQVRPLNDADFAELGMGQSSVLSGYFDWFIAQASEPLPVGMYHASAILPNYQPDECEPKEVSEEFSTYYDLALRPFGPAKVPPAPDPLPVIVDPNGGPSLNGWVLGQSEKGEHLGPIANATVEILAGDAVAATANTSEIGYYFTPVMKPGPYTYRVTATGFAPEDAGRGFVLPNDDEVHVLDFVLSKGSDKPVPMPKPAVLEGYVWWMEGEDEEDKEPIPGATVSARLGPTGGLIMGTTNQEGFYELVLPAGSWQAAAMVPDLGSHVHPETIQLPEGGRDGVDFVFNEMPVCETELYVLVAVEGAEGDAPDIEFFQETETGEEVGVAALLEPLGSDPTTSASLRDLGIEPYPPEEGEWRWYLGIPETPVMPGPWAADGLLEGSFPDVSEVRVVEEGLPTFLELVLERMIPELVVIAEDKDGKPIPGLTVKVVNKTAGQSLVDALTLTTATGGDCMTDLDGGMATYNVMVSGLDYEAQGREVEVREEETTARFRMFKEGDMRVADFPGLVVKRIEGSSGKPEDVVRVPVAEAEVRVEPMAYQEVPQNYERVSLTGAKGEFLYKELQEGTYYVSVLAPCCESWSGPVEVAFGMEETVIELDQCNQILEGGLRMVLTEGWGESAVQKDAAERGYNRALKEAPDDCRADYARALAAMAADDVESARTVVAGAVKKTPDDLFWDRACGLRIWSTMFLGELNQAATEIRSLVQKYYVSREPNRASEETAFVLGASVGFMMGPAMEEAASLNPESLDQALESALKEPHKTAYRRGRDLCLNDFLDIRDEEAALAAELQNAASSEKEAADAQRRARMAQIEPELNRLGPEIEILEQNIQQETINCQGRMQSFVQQQQQLDLQVRQIQASINEQSQCLAQDNQEYGSIMAIDPAGAAAILEEMRMHEGQIAMLNRQINALRLQLQQVTMTVNSMQVECRQKIDSMTTESTRKRQDYDRMYREWQDLDVLCRNPIDPRKMESPELMDLAEEKKAFDAYCGYPLDERKQELLAMLPCGLDEGDTPPPLPESTYPDEEVPPVTAADLQAPPSAYQPMPATGGTSMTPPVAGAPSPLPSLTPSGSTPSGGMIQDNPPPAGGGMTSDEKEVLEIINQLREQNGLPKFTHDSKLTACARDHSQDMQRFGFFDHESPVPGKKTPWDRAEKFGADANAENIAQNGGGPSSVIGTWMNSEGHRANIMNPAYTRMGVGKVGEYWTQLFGK